ncbi:hypothetical protein [Ruania zhangjianzhongii]|uniref:hypothetical protein n=1 Tax=Ruania zhangjianzhongii TaxID=2603206 RepID=UPI0011C796EA|nr:hypothetical protein [Ruania zhangjianzhongii]
MSSSPALTPSRWTRPLQVLTALCSVVFLIGTTLQNFVVVDVALIETMMTQAGGADPGGEAPGFTTGFRIVGCLYMLGNALGILAFWLRSRWLFWVVLAVNLTQGLGFAMIPSQMWTAVIERYGVPGILPSAVTDGGAALLAAVLIGTLVRYRRPWALLPARTDAATTKASVG